MGVAKTSLIILNCNKTMILRLRNKSYFTNTTNYTWTLKPYPRFIEKYNCFVPCQRYKAIAVNKNCQNDLIKENIYIPEHKVMHLILEDSIHYDKTIFPRIKSNAVVTSEDIECLYNVDWSYESPENTLNAVKKLAYSYLSGTCLERSLYDGILEACIKHLPVMQDKQIKTLMQRLITLHDIITVSPLYKRLMKELNAKCIKQFYSSNTEQMLLIIDAIYQLDNTNLDFIWRALRKLLSKPHKLSGKQLVQVFFVLPLIDSRSFINMFEIECRLQECLHELVADEIGIIARGFFLNKRTIKNKALMPIIMDKVKIHATTVNSASLAAIMKIIRYSDCVHCIKDFKELLKSLHAEIPRLPLKCLIHITHAFASLRVYDEFLTNAIIQRIENEMETARVKDIERVIYGICTVTPITDYYRNVCQKLLNEIILTYKTTRANEINSFPISLVRILTFLTIKNIYVPELIQYVFDPKFMTKTYKNNLKFLTNEWLILHCSIKIELPYYKGPLLTDNMYEYLIQKYHTHDDDTYRKDLNVKLKIEIVHICEQKLGIDVHVDYILPHYSTRDIVIGIDACNNPIEIESILSTMPTNTIKSVNNDELKRIKWKVIIPLPILTEVSGHNGYIGYIQRKCRQLELIGYTPIIVSENRWIALNEESKVKHLKQLIYQDIKSFQ
ncbi:FAST kinase domain-containing protein 5, mitochondrial [Bombus terrestris]|uniref:FAST kinase domain-containing protein 5, mitochondrial n=1 Tax=Bombus terrestris TaxID=30195 RepID=A0A9B0BRG6_BOMTE|nr:FAST kinase domain-containing protein 5, mitochondrial [Bombus terrestris]